jgi:hypothetical protein
MKDLWGSMIVNDVAIFVLFLYAVCFSIKVKELATRKEMPQDAMVWFQDSDGAFSIKDIDLDEFGDCCLS